MFRRWLALLIPLACVAGALALLAPANADPFAMPFAGATSTSTIDNRTGEPAFVSCWSSTGCVELDSTGHASTYDGTSWSAPEVVYAAAGATLAPNVVAPNMTALSCPSESFCLASAMDGAIFADVNGTWTTIRPSQGGWSSTILTCPSADFCMLNDGGAGVETYVNGVLGAGVAMPSGAWPSSLSCASDVSCEAVSGSEVYQWNGQTWSGTLVFPDEQGQGGWISCPTTTFCGATSGSEEAFYVNGSWTTPVSANISGVFGPEGPEGTEPLSCTPDGSCSILLPTGSVRVDTPAGQGTPSILDAADMPRAISCAAAGDCAAVSLWGSAWTENAGTWGASATIDPPTGMVTDLSCTSPTYCLAVDQWGATMTYDGSSWSQPLPHPGYEFAHVSCVSSTFCAAVGWRYAHPVVATEINGQWSYAPGIAGDVSCASPTYCAAVASDGESEVWNGSTWSTLSGLPQGVTTVSCPADGFCSAGSAELNGSTWTSTPTPSMLEGEAGSVSCASPTFCLTSTPLGLATFDGSAWTLETPRVPQPQNATVSCASTTFCLLDGDPWVDGAQGTTALIPNVGVIGQSCPTPTFCAVVDNQSAGIWQGPPPLTTIASAVSIGNTGVVGSPLTAQLTGSWQAGSTSLTPDYQWYTVSGTTWTAIQGATAATFTPAADMIGQSVAVRVTANAPNGYQQAWPVSSAAVQIQARPLTTQPSAVTVSGSGVPGSPLVANLVGSWQADATALQPSYQWIVVTGSAWVAIPGATGATVTPTAGMVGQDYAVRVTATSPAGYQTASTVVSGSVLIRQGTLTTSGVSIRGMLQVGSTLRVATGAWKAGTVTLTGTHLAYQWYANGVRIRGAQYSYFRPTGAFIGKQMRVRVTGSYPGYATASRSSSLSARIRA